MALETRETTLSFRASISEGTEGTKISGYASVWGSRNTFGEVFVPGAFQDTLADRSAPIVMGYMHRDAIGRWTVAREDEEGLYLEGPVSQTTLGRDAAVLVRDEAMTGLSIGFLPAEVQFAGPGERVTFQTPFGTRSYQFDDYTVYVLRVAELAEASLVMAPSDDEARVLAVRSKLQKAERALPALRAADGGEWADVAYSMALLMGGRGASSFTDLPDVEHYKLWSRTAALYERHGKTPPSYERAPKYADVEFRHDERAVFTDRYLRKRLDDVVSGAAGVNGQLSAETRERASIARDALTELLERRSRAEQLAETTAALRQAAAALAAD